MNLQGRVALVTGGGSGIGRASARLLCARGAKVGIVGRTESKLEDAAAAIREETGGEVMALPGDVSDPRDVQTIVRTMMEAWDRLDVVFANAGINGVWAPLDELTPEEWDKTLAINLKGTFLTVKYALPGLRQRGGSVIITSSVNGNRTWSNTGATAYSCSKAAQVAFCKMVALELAEDHIRVNVVCPGAIETRIEENMQTRNVEKVREPVEFPQGHIPLSEGEPGHSEEVARLVAFLASDEASHISGTEIYVDGAESLLKG
jgi:NAD(P)-dependent dehydrogenase (short-subunit alcohol dehydrogenase family)